MTRITLTLDADLAAALRSEAEREDRAISSVARRAFASYFGTKPFFRKRKTSSIPETTICTYADEKRALITGWIATAIGIEDAKKRGLVQISNATSMRNWTSRESLYDFAQQATQSQPVLVRIDDRRAALFGISSTRSRDDRKPTAAAKIQSRKEA